MGTYNNYCRKCGKVIYGGKLRCSDCRKKVDDEIYGKVDRPFNYYFRWFKCHKKDLWNWKGK